MPRRGTSARAAALRQAQQAKAARDAERLSREKDIEAALADYFEAIERARRIRAEAQRKAGQLMAGAELAARAPGQDAAAAVHRLRDLMGTAAEVAVLCGVTASAVRAMLAGPPPASDPDRAAVGPVNPAGLVAAPGGSADETAESGAEPVIPAGAAPGDAGRPETAAPGEGAGRG